MRHILSILLTILILAACTENNNLVNPDEQFDQVLSTASQNNWLKIPAYTSNNQQRCRTVTKSINCSKGGNININMIYTGINGDPIANAHAKIKFAPNAWDTKVYGKTIEITGTLDTETASVTLYPHMSFINPPVANISFEGLDLSNVDCDNLKFIYIAENGENEDITYKEISFDEIDGSIEVINAIIPHFSRFGFLN